MSYRYTLNPFQYTRFPTREVKVGDIGIGGKNPIRVQSMTTSDTCDTDATVKQIVDLYEVGCEIVRVTVPSMADAENLKFIRTKLSSLNCKVPIVADIHFTPTVALKVVEYVEKVRINPGNFADKKKFATRDYTDSEYNLEIERISEIFVPLVKRCKELGVAMRIGTNHGSLSDRIMNRYGDTPLGMVESALEFIKIAESENYHEIVVSMKASNPQVMINAYRLLVSRYREENLNYPIHLGVTEAGDGRDGRIKSAMGIGSLLEDGIGDTIRVSLTEDSIYEIPVAKKLVEKYNSYLFSEKVIKDTIHSEYKDQVIYSNRNTDSIWIGDYKIGENYPVRIESYISLINKTREEILEIITKNAVFSSIKKHEIFYFSIKTKEEFESLLNVKNNIENKAAFSVDLSNMDTQLLLSIQDKLTSFEKICISLEFLSKFKEEFFKLHDNRNQNNKSIEIKVPSNSLSTFKDIFLSLNTYENVTVSLSQNKNESIFNTRKLASYVKDSKVPILLEVEIENLEDGVLESSAILGSLLLDNIGNSIRIIDLKSEPDTILEISFDILQSARLRTTKTEFISCPSCGRTLFNLQDTTARIKSKTGHLKGVKIAIMGCIVNGPGEMADADFGYVGAGPGKVHLYLGKEIVSKNIPSEIADEKLIELIKENGKWVDV
jgi:(E)-4-hydroxy-3-methylbut-2-enyl-diphosphate synthase